jgi:hypothetical protein
LIGTLSKKDATTFVTVDVRKRPLRFLSCELLRRPSEVPVQALGK